MLKSLLLIGAGSCVGGMFRYLTQQYVEKHYPSSIPFGTLAVNIIGCFIIGILYALADRENILSPSMRLLLATGFCGGYTTFSSFALENISLMQDGQWSYAAFYILMSVFFGCIAVFLGVMIVKFLF